ncbi:alpha/beta hydrolase fold domain-containing protein [Niveispirillum sp. SYP-B3756]|uniref:alpha/beta hydrolase n=1 Tax=Niveispirillum sp. SYP-B3756 TaxID=2662178 RepID=UPI00129234B0|nr:alpha/beta hydrolase [Niveispirillum sp. SYP-B3756]MQP66859.1 alpha/beta hydrolase fold domain-containing protein [Niveispirillum sp. SYP-B3756]
MMQSRAVAFMGLLLLTTGLAACRRAEDNVTAQQQQAAVAGVLAGSCEGVRPQPDSLDGAFSVTYAHPGNRDLRLHIFQPAEDAGPAPHPAILFFFGGSWRVGEITAFQEQADAFVAAGFAAILADYRVKCRDGSNALQSLNDAEDAYEWLRHHAASLGIDPKRLILAGGSAGGHLALATALQADEGEKPAALVLFNPVVDLATPAPFYLKPLAWWISPIAMDVGALPPTLIFHGTADSKVPIASIRHFCANAQAEGRTCQVMEYEGADHSFYTSHVPDPRLGTSPHAHTLEAALALGQAVAQGSRWP